MLMVAGFISLSPRPARKTGFYVSRSLAARAKPGWDPRVMSLSLSDARTKAAEYRALIARGVDPLGGKAEAAPLFAEVADNFIRDQAPRWRDPKAVRDWTNSLRLHAKAGLPRRKWRVISDRLKGSGDLDGTGQVNAARMTGPVFFIGIAITSQWRELTYS
jgi:hypothetical protein